VEGAHVPAAAAHYIYKVAQRTHRRSSWSTGAHRLYGRARYLPQWLGNATEQGRKWRDTQVRVEGPVAAQMQAIFSKTGFSRRGDTRRQRLYPSITPAGTITAQRSERPRGRFPRSPRCSLCRRSYPPEKPSILQRLLLPDKQYAKALIGAGEARKSSRDHGSGLHNNEPMVRSASWHHYGDCSGRRQDL